MSATENDKNSIKVTNPTKKPPLTDRQEKNKTHSTINNSYKNGKNNRKFSDRQKRR